MDKKIKVKLVSRCSSDGEGSRWGQQAPGRKGIIGNCEFTFNALNKDYDWLVVIDDVPRINPDWQEILSCPQNNTIFVTTEPSNIARYGRAFVKQFKYLITNQKAKYLPHSNAVRSQTGNIWFYDKEYDDIISGEPNKTKLISTVCSDKQQGHTMHKLRFDFTKKLEEALPELERFGHGIKFVEYKYESLDDYKFHLAIENNTFENAWTEKIADSFLAYCLPIYCGCSNITDYFPEDSLVQIDINDFEGSLAKIKEIISTPGEYEKRLPAIKEARRRVIEEYNLLEMVNKIIANDDGKFSHKGKRVLYNRRVMRFKYLPDLCTYFVFRMSNSIKNIISKIK